MKMPQEAAAAALALAAACNKPQGIQKHTPEESRHHHPQFHCDESAAEAPPKVLQLWHRAEEGLSHIDVEKLLRQWPKLPGLPSHAHRHNVPGDAI